MNKLPIITIILTTLISCDSLDPEDYSPQKQADEIRKIVKFSLNRDSLFANASDTTIIKVQFIEEVSKESAVINFKITNGTIKESKEKEYEVNADFSEKNNFKFQIAEATFISSNLGYSNVVISAKIDAITLYDTIYYKHMPVKNITITLNQFQLINTFDSTLAITGTTESNSGTPTIGQKIIINVYDSVYNKLSSDLNFISKNLKTNQSGNFSVLFSSGNINYDGISFIVAYLDGNENTVADTAFLFLKNP